MTVRWVNPSKQAPDPFSPNQRPCPQANTPLDIDCTIPKGGLRLLLCLLHEGDDILLLGHQAHPTATTTCSDKRARNTSGSTDTLGKKWERVGASVVTVDRSGVLKSNACCPVKGYNACGDHAGLLAPVMHMRSPALKVCPISSTTLKQSFSSLIRPGLPGTQGTFAFCTVDAARMQARCVQQETRKCENVDVRQEQAYGYEGQNKVPVLVHMCEIAPLTTLPCACARVNMCTNLNPCTNPSRSPQSMFQSQQCRHMLQCASPSKQIALKRSLATYLHCLPG
eukprot:scaffold91065_cov16-Tisochrysis_lutea.AAC.1